MAVVLPREEGYKDIEYGKTFRGKLSIVSPLR